MDAVLSYKAASAALLVPPSLAAAADEGVGFSDLVFLVRRSLLERKKEKEEEEAHRIKEKEMQVKALFGQRSNFAQL